MRIMGLDVGEKTIGVAVSDDLGWTAQGVDVIRRSTPDRDFGRLQTIACDFDVEQVVVGLPKNMDGTFGRGQKMPGFCPRSGAAARVACHVVGRAVNDDGGRANAAYGRRHRRGGSKSLTNWRLH